MPRNRSVSAVLGSSVPRPRPQPFSSRNRSALRRRGVVAGLVVLSLILITVSFREPTSGPLHGVQAAGATVLRPFEIAAERVARPFRDVYGYFADLIHVKKENAELKDEVNRLRQQALLGESARAQNTELRDQLRFIDSPLFPSDYTAVNTRIIGWRSEFDERLRHETQMPVHLAESPLTCVAVGSGRSLEEFEAIHRSSKVRRNNHRR